MIEAAYRVRIIVDPDFGEKSARLPVREPVWVVDSAANTPVAKRLRGEWAPTSHLDGVTVFTPFLTGGREQILLNVLDTVDLHHGHYSADPAYSEVEVYGVPLSDAMERAFRALGFTAFRATADGFITAREGKGGCTNS